jgi:cell wall-associated NlpC family hydrolase
MNSVLYDYAMSLVGIFYRWGGSNPIDGFDCSGLVQEILASVGKDPIGDQTAQGLHDHYMNPANGVDYTDLKFQPCLGTLAFYGKSRTEITHITFLINEFQCVGANGGGSKTVSKDIASKQNAFVKVRPFRYRNDLVALVMPFYPDNY